MFSLVRNYKQLFSMCLMCNYWAETSWEMECPIPEKTKEPSIFKYLPELSDNVEYKSSFDDIINRLKQDTNNLISGTKSKLENIFDDSKNSINLGNDKSNELLQNSELIKAQIDVLIKSPDNAYNFNVDLSSGLPKNNLEGVISNSITPEWLDKKIWENNQWLEKIITPDFLKKEEVNISQSDTEFVWPPKPTEEVKTEDVKTTIEKNDAEKCEIHEVKKWETLWKIVKEYYSLTKNSEITKMVNMVVDSQESSTMAKRLWKDTKPENLKDGIKWDNLWVWDKIVLPPKQAEKVQEPQKKSPIEKKEETDKPWNNYVEPVLLDWMHSA